MTTAIPDSISPAYMLDLKCAVQRKVAAHFFEGNNWCVYCVWLCYPIPDIDDCPEIVQDGLTFAEAVRDLLKRPDDPSDLDKRIRLYRKAQDRWYYRNNDEPSFPQPILKPPVIYRISPYPRNVMALGDSETNFAVTPQFNLSKTDLIAAKGFRNLGLSLP